MNTLVSIILPTYNRAHVLDRAIQSVLDQTFPDFELIIVDDGSSDNTAEIINSFQDPRIRYLKHHTNRGVSAARNTGIKEAKGAFIGFQDSDDEWLPEKLEYQMKLFLDDKEDTIALVTCGLIKTRSRGERIFLPKEARLNYEDLLAGKHHYGTGTQCLLIKRSLANHELYFDERLPAREDWDLVLRLSRLGRISSVPKPLIKYHRVSGANADNNENALEAQLVIIHKYDTEFQRRPAALANHLARIVFNYLNRNNFQLAKKYLQSAVSVYPWKIDILLCYLSSLAGYSCLKMVLRLRWLFKSTRMDLFNE